MDFAQACPAIFSVGLIIQNGRNLQNRLYAILLPSKWNFLCSYLLVNTCFVKVAGLSDLKRELSSCSKYNFTFSFRFSILVEARRVFRFLSFICLHEIPSVTAKRPQTISCQNLLATNDVSQLSSTTHGVDSFVLLTDISATNYFRFAGSVFLCKFYF